RELEGERNRAEVEYREFRARRPDRRDAAGKGQPFRSEGQPKRRGAVPNRLRRSLPPREETGDSLEQIPGAVHVDLVADIEGVIEMDRHVERLAHHSLDVRVRKEESGERGASTSRTWQLLALMIICTCDPDSNPSATTAGATTLAIQATPPVRT